MDGSGLFMPKGLQHARSQFVLTIGARRVLHHPFVIGQLTVEQRGSTS